MSLVLIPIEILHEISAYLSTSDIFSLINVSQLLHTRLIRTLYYLANEHRIFGSTTLTNRLQDVTFWFDRSGNSSVLEWAVVHGRISTFERLLYSPGIDLLQADRYGVTLLHRISGQGLVRYMKPLVGSLKLAGIDPFQPDLSQLTPLHYAAGRDRIEAVQLLITLGADVSAKDHHGNTPLHLAAVTGSHLAFAQLVEAGADINAKARFGWMPIDQASITHRIIAVHELKRLGSLPPTWPQRHDALNEFVRLSPCPLDCYVYHVDLP
jgi:ankyrin repeat protein